MEPARVARSNDDTHERLGLYVEVVKYALAKYAIDDVIAGAVREMASFRQGRGTIAVDFASQYTTRYSDARMYIRDPI